jgi:hypothetical protein
MADPRPFIRSVMATEIAVVLTALHTSNARGHPIIASYGFDEKEIDSFIAENIVAMP